MNNKIFLIGAIVLLVVLALIMAVFNFGKKQSDQSADKPVAGQKNSLDIQNAVIKSIYKDIKEIKNINIEPSDKKMWWVSNDGYSILNESYSGIKIIKKASPSEINDNIEEDPDFSKIVSTASGHFERSGYTGNDLNYSGPENGRRYYDFVKSYEKNGDICSIVVSQDIFGFDVSTIEMYINCTNNFDENYQEQKPLLDALGLKNKNAIIVGHKNVENYYNVSIGLRRTGYYVIIRKNNEVYEKIYEGQEDPECELMDEYSVPAKIYDKCWDGTSVVDKE